MLYMICIFPLISLTLAITKKAAKKTKSGGGGGWGETISDAFQLECACVCGRGWRGGGGAVGWMNGVRVCACVFVCGP